MRRFIVILLVLLPFVSKAQQLDTVNIECEYFNQYIYPPLIDNSSNRETLNELFGFDLDMISNLYSFINNNPSTVEEIAQKYEVAENDSVSIFGVSLSVSYRRGVANYYDTITISILDSNLSNTIYSQTFVSMGTTQEILDLYQQPEGFNGSSFPFVECIFDDTITLHENYYISYKNNKHCNIGENIDPLFMCLSEYSYNTTRPDNYCVPYSCSSKYKPYVKLCHDNRSWHHVDEINWAVPYYDIAGYGGSSFVANNCDTLVYKAVGIMPIQVLQDTSSDSLDSGVVSVELLEENIEIYPNPAKDVLNINSAFAIKEVEIYDALNRLIEKRKANKRNIQLNIANYKAGSYIVKINTTKGSVKKKLIVE